jgi:hypothetical protein
MSIAELNKDCPECGQLIQRNSALFDGQLWHWGCLKNDERFGTAVAQCLGCFSYLTNSKITRDANTRFCGHCGSQQIRMFEKNPAEWREPEVHY